MTEGPGQQPPQEPRNGAPEGGREVLEGRVIPSRPQRPAPQDDPRRQYAAPSADGPAWAPPPGQSQGQPWSARPGQPAAGAPAAGTGAGTPPPADRKGAPAQSPPPQGGPRQGAPSGFGVPGTGRAPRQPVPPQPAAGSGAAGTPDWTALAEAQAASGARRRRIMMLTGGIVAVAVIAGGVATAVVLSGKSSGDTVAGPSASGTTTASQQSLPPEPSFSSVAPPPPANPLDYLSTAAKDKAPVTVDSLFPGKQFVMNGRTYVKTASTTTQQCATGARAAVAQALTANGCTQLVRATYVNGTLAVTVGVAVFPDGTHAAKLQKVAQYLAPLNGGGVKDFCHAVACQMTSNAVGRYAYFAISGFKNGTTLPATDSVARRAANEASNFAFERIIQRGRDAAAADPARR
ncbi:MULTISPECIES: hypothetical protein [unclassified Streptomyces]|uniref:hypothetical protein n=1 Tax=unclassified Streptomyces TaxID=2593676 RepID=UPI002E2974D6|nr:hypothetical protein [Streptomyces sp. NBC_00223]